MAELSNTVAMITGASRGLGAALAEAFADAGARISLCARGADALETVCARIRGQGHECIGMPLDVRDPAAAARWVELTTDHFGAPDLLINSASVLGSRAPLPNYDVAEWRDVIDINLTGTLVVTQAVLEPMLAAGHGCIVNVSSGAAVPPRENWGAYGVSKAAVDALSLNLSRELSGTGIRVNLVDPGSLRTDMRAAAYPEEDPASVKEPAAIARLFLWLASREASKVNGERFQADAWLNGRH